MASIPSYASSSLYVGDLASEVTEGMLFEIFNQVGPVASIRVCRDAVTRRSLGYAYVNFHNVVDAERALDTLNNTTIKGKLCRIMWSQRDPSVRKSGAGNIFIKNLDKSIDHKTLNDTFMMFGTILSCKVVTNADGESKGYGFVHYDSDEAASKAIAKVNGMMIAGKKVYVAPFQARKERIAAEEAKGPRFTNVYVKNLPLTVKTEEELKAMFGKYGKITSVMLPKEEVPKEIAEKKLAGEKVDAEAAAQAAEGDGAAVELPRGFAFVNFDEAESAAKCIDELNGKELEDGKTLYVGRAQKKSEREAAMKKQAELRKLERLSKYQGVNLYVKNLEDTIDDDKLREEFAPYGTITSCRVMKDEKTGASKGFGFVCFSTSEEATRAVTEMNSKMVGAKPIYVALAQRKEVRRAQLEVQHSRRGPNKAGAAGVAAPGVAPGMPGMYPPGAPVFYAAPPGAAGPGGQPGFVYPQQMMPRGGQRGPWQGAPGAYPMAGGPGGYVVGMQPGAGPNGQQRRGGPGGAQQMQGAAGAQQQRRGGAQPANGNGAQQRNGGGAQQRPPQDVAATMQAIANAPLDPKRIAELPADQQKMVLGEKLYPLIAASQPELAGKITGMLLDSYFSEEIIHLIETPDALAAKIAEALAVLEQHAKSQQQKE